MIYLELNFPNFIDLYIQRTYYLKSRLTHIKYYNLNIF